jgi:hypothetical protein
MLTLQSLSAGSSSGLPHHRHLRHVDGPAAEPALAIHEIISPEVVECLAELMEVAACNCLVITFAPALQRFGVIECKAFSVVP